MRTGSKLQDMSLETRYITVDLVVRGNGETNMLASALEAKGYVVVRQDCDDGNKWHLNVSCPYVVDEPDTCILRCCADLESLTEGAKEEWRQANFREFSIGYETGERPFCFENHIGADTLGRAARLGAGIGIVLYAARGEVHLSG
jgi:hypothetical protein